MGIIQKASEFLGIDKFGKGIASAYRNGSLPGFIEPIKGRPNEVDQDIQAQQAVDASAQKLLYAAKRESDPVKKRRLLELANQTSGNIRPEQIDPGLNLTNKEVLGSAANTALNIAAPGSFKGGKAAVIGKNALTGAGFGAAQGLEKNRSVSGIAGSTVGGAAIGGAVGTVGVIANALKNFITRSTPEFLMNKAVKPALQDLKKSVKFGIPTLSQELLEEGVKGGPKKLLEIADTKITSLEDELQSVLNHPGLAEAKIPRNSIAPYLQDVTTQKTKLPGGKSDIARIQEIFDDLPEQMSLPEANEIKRSIYQELRDPAYKLDAHLSTKAQTLKLIARGLKEQIEEAVGGTVVNDINRKLSIYGRLENAMVDQLAREMRNNGVGLTDAILFSGGATTTVLALLRHLGQGAETYAAQGLYKGRKAGTGILSKTAKGIMKRATLNAP